MNNDLIEKIRNGLEFHLRSFVFFNQDAEQMQDDLADVLLPLGDLIITECDSWIEQS